MKSTRRCSLSASTCLGTLCTQGATSSGHSVSKAVRPHTVVSSGRAGAVDRKCRAHSGQQGPHLHAAEDAWRPGPDLLHPAGVPLHLGEQADGRHRQGTLQRVLCAHSVSHACLSLLKQMQSPPSPQKRLRSSTHHFVLVMVFKKNKI